MRNQYLRHWILNFNVWKKKRFLSYTHLGIMIREYDRSAEELIDYTRQFSMNVPTQEIDGVDGITKHDC